MVQMQYSNNQHFSVSPPPLGVGGLLLAVARYSKMALVCCFGIALGGVSAEVPVNPTKNNVNAALAQAEVVGIYFTPPSDVAAAIRS